MSRGAMTNHVRSVAFAVLIVLTVAPPSRAAGISLGPIECGNKVNEGQLVADQVVGALKCATTSLCTAAFMNADWGVCATVAGLVLENYLKDRPSMSGNLVTIVSEIFFLTDGTLRTLGEQLRAGGQVGEEAKQVLYRMLGNEKGARAANWLRDRGPNWNGRIDGWNLIGPILACLQPLCDFLVNVAQASVEVYNAYVDPYIASSQPFCSRAPNYCAEDVYYFRFTYAGAFNDCVQCCESTQGNAGCEDGSARCNWRTNCIRTCGAKYLSGSGDAAVGDAIGRRCVNEANGSAFAAALGAAACGHLAVLDRAWRAVETADGRHPYAPDELASLGDLEACAGAAFLRPGVRFTAEERAACAYFADPSRFRFLETSGFLSSADGLIGHGNVWDAIAQLARFGCGTPDVAALGRAGGMREERLDGDRDGDIDLQDLTQLLAQVGTCTSDATLELAGDLDADGCVTEGDVSIMTLVPIDVTLAANGAGEPDGAAGEPTGSDADDPDLTGVE